MPTARTYLDPGTAVDPDVRKICAEIVAHFPAIPNVWGYATTADHNSRRCIDYMVIGQGSDAARVKLGNEIRDYHIASAPRFGVNGVIWNGHVYGFPHTGGIGSGHYRGPYGEARKYTLPNQHLDHVHVEYDGRTYVPMPVVSLAALVAAAQADPKGKQGATTHTAADDVKVVESALVRADLLESIYARDGSFGSLSVGAYAGWQKRLGYAGADADGIPGRSSLDALGKAYGFTVTA